MNVLSAFVIERFRRKVIVPLAGKLEVRLKVTHTVDVNWHICIQFPNMQHTLF